MENKNLKKLTKYIKAKSGERVVIHILNNEELRAICNILDSCGLRWVEGRNLLTYDDGGYPEGFLGYNLNVGRSRVPQYITRSDIPYYRSQYGSNLKIFESKEIIALFSTTTTTTKISPLQVTKEMFIWL